ncbi:MAG TPA: SDR family oxidoreductase [Allosphingosinicella sp.]|nr:SDR family oxidoreductase [Allosphingosinicella sp.]
MPSVLITGAGRGLGLEFARQYAQDGWEVIATVRGEAPELERLGVRIEQLDMRDFAAVASFGERLSGAPLDLLIANAGMSGPQRIGNPQLAADWQEVHAVNAVAPTLLAEAVLPNVLGAQGKMVAITSRMGSIADSSGGYVAYRASKAALNAAWRSLALDLAGRPVTLAMFHPGWVQTDMGGSNAPISAAESVAALRRIIARLEPKDSGSFLDRDGSSIPW